MSDNEGAGGLRAELEKVDQALARPMEALSMAILGAATALLLCQLAFAAQTAAVALPLLTFGLGLSVAGRFCGRRAKGLILDLRGYRCANCGKTPRPAAATAGFPLGYCPHCQRKR